MTYKTLHRKLKIDQHYKPGDELYNISFLIILTKMSLLTCVLYVSMLINKQIHYIAGQWFLVINSTHFFQSKSYRHSYFFITHDIQNGCLFFSLNLAALHKHICLIVIVTRQYVYQLLLAQICFICFLCIVLTIMQCYDRFNSAI